MLFSEQIPGTNSVVLMPNGQYWKWLAAVEQPDTGHFRSGPDALSTGHVIRMTTINDLQ